MHGPYQLVEDVLEPTRRRSPVARLALNDGSRVRGHWATLAVTEMGHRFRKACVAPRERAFGPFATTSAR